MYQKYRISCANWYSQILTTMYFYHDLSRAFYDYLRNGRITVNGHDRVETNSELRSPENERSGP
jgi:hypothetical protein